MCGRGRLKLYAALRPDVLVMVRVFNLLHLGDEIGRIDDLDRRVSAGQDHVDHGRLALSVSTTSSTSIHPYLIG